MKLFVDDLRDCPSGWILARSITEAIRILDTMLIEVVSLDHDIVYLAGPIHETYEPVARFISHMDEKIKPKVEIHTGNPIGRKRLEEILK